MSKVSASRFRAGVADPQVEWSRRKLRALLAAGALVVLALVVGAVWSSVQLLSPTSADSVTGSLVTGDSAEDRLANQPLLSAPPEAAQPGRRALSLEQVATIELPLPMTVGEAGVASGFAKTPQGALAQLASIDAAALQSTSISGAQDVIAGWAAPGGPTIENWSGVRAVATFLQAAGRPADGSDRLMLSVEPAMGFIKGQTSNGVVVPCIDFIVTATTPEVTQQVATSDCQRMAWVEESGEGRWVIAPGSEPAPAPSVWPGTQDSIDAGYQWLEFPQQ